MLLKHISLLLAAFLASLSASSFPVSTALAFIHATSMCQLSFSRVAAFFLISSIRCFLIFEFLRDDRVILLSVYIITFRGVLLLSFIVSISCSTLRIALCSAGLFEHLLWSLCLIWCVSLFFVYMAIPEPTLCSFLLPSVHMWIV
jgi:hypothetical protein